MKEYFAEKVLVVPRSALFPAGAFRGFQHENMDRLSEIIERESFFMERRIAEEDPSHKQIIPYIILTSNGNIFTVKRLKGQGESRLHQKVSIGLGGHINPEDAADGRKPLEAALWRELSEEVFIQEKWEARILGMINDDQTPVGSVHFGIVFKVELPFGKVTVRETEKMSGSFLSPSEAARSYDRMESWSQFVFSSLFPEMRFAQEETSGFPQ